MHSTAALIDARVLLVARRSTLAPPMTAQLEHADICADVVPGGLRAKLDASDKLFAQYKLEEGSAAERCVRRSVWTREARLVPRSAAIPFAARMNERSWAL